MQLALRVIRTGLWPCWPSPPASGRPSPSGWRRAP